LPDARHRGKQSAHRRVALDLDAESRPLFLQRCKQKLVRTASAVLLIVVVPVLMTIAVLALGKLD
jgi:hypothetical protein